MKAASAFTGAWLFPRDFSGQSQFFLLLAVLVGFSCNYLGDYYPSDVLSEAHSGIEFVESVQQVQPAMMRALDRDIGAIDWKNYETVQLKNSNNRRINFTGF
jgi:hypothetical protein